MSILLRDTRTGIITSTDLFGDTLGLYLRENPDIVRVGLGTTANSDYYVLLNSNDIESTQPNVSNNLKFNPYTGSLSGISSISGTIGYASSAGIATYASSAGYASSITVGLDNSNETRYISFIKSTSGINTISVDTDLTYNPSTGVINSLKFVKTGATATNFLKANGDDSVLLSSEVTNALGYVPANSASVTGQYPIGNSIILDDFSSSFNGSTTDFSLASASVPFIPAASSANLIVSVGGIIQKPGTDFSIIQSGGVNTSAIRFSTAPVSGLSCFVVALGGQGALLSDVSWSAKGDMVVASGDNVAAILGVGANNTILIADTSASAGVKWGSSISNLTITGTLTGNVSGNLTGDVTGNVSGTAGGLTGSPNITITDLTSSGNSNLKLVTETTANTFSTTLTPSTGTLTVDVRQGTVVLGTLSSSVTTWAFTNVPSANSKTTTITIIIAGNTSRTYGDACSINGSVISSGIKWSGGTAPTSTNNYDIIAFAIVKDSAGTINVFGGGNMNYS